MTTVKFNYTTQKSISGKEPTYRLGRRLVATDNSAKSWTHSIEVYGRVAEAILYRIGGEFPDFCTLKQDARDSYQLSETVGVQWDKHVQIMSMESEKSLGQIIIEGDDIEVDIETEVPKSF